MTKLRGFSGPVEDLERAWPETLAAADPYAGDERLSDPMDAARLERISAAWDLDAAALAAWDAEFLRVHGAVLDGRATVAELAAVAARHGLDVPFRSDRRSPVPVGRVLPDEVIADLAADLVPDLGLVAVDRVLGPWADLSPPRRVRRAASTVMAYAPLTRQGVRPAARARETKPLIALWIRSGLKAVHMAPPMLWRVQEDGSLEPRLPLAGGWRPTGPVSGLPPGADQVVGRAVHHKGGWWLACGLPVGPVPDDLSALMARLSVAGWRLRRHEPRLTWEDLLRDRGEVLYRALCEWGWHEWPEALWHSWQAWSASPDPWAADPKAS